ncbi:MAG: flagellin [Actinomycetes bacterium]
MALRIDSNLEALTAYRNLSVASPTQAGATKAAARVTLSQRITAAAAEGSGLSVSELMRSQLSGLSQASRNAQTGLGVAQTADGALANTQTLLTRMRDLTVTASSAGAVTPGITAEVGALSSTIDTIAATTQFSGHSLIGASGYTGTFAIAAPGSAQEPVTMTIPAATAGSLGVASLDLSTPASAAAATQTVQGALDQVSATRSALGRFKAMFTQAVNRITVAVQNVSSVATAAIGDSAAASSLTGATRTQILAEPAMAMAAQGGEGTAALMKLLA